MQAMDCKTCNELLAEYKLWVSFYKDAVHSIPGALEDDARVFVEYAAASDRIAERPAMLS